MMKRVLTLEQAKAVAAAAETFADSHNFKVVIAVVDDGGHLLYLQRDHEAQFGSVEVAIGKACSAVAFRRPTAAWEERLKEGRYAYLMMPGLVGLQGGVPLKIGGQVVGGIGVSGVTSQDDERIALAGADRLLTITEGNEA
ncbi:heme-binding protein [Pelomicrobium methylotrophicum]|uniref:Heme-binding protein n=2 Tax=Pelomicrobium methylotrophicum TaxID=2602750 RepID=A0A5C7ETP2_9PROT|nr:heme-binding protein [Pelomicrobium methylotrophicum]TXF10727.1 heme-binding protein [Pelomicrobium methylotrophicum]